MKLKLVDQFSVRLFDFLSEEMVVLKGPSHVPGTGWLMVGGYNKMPKIKIFKKITCQKSHLRGDYKLDCG